MLPPDQFPDAMPKRRRILEELPKAPPLPPPAPTAAALAEQAARDQTLKEILAFRLNPVLAELKKRHNRKATLTAAEALVRWQELVERDELIEEQEQAAAKEAKEKAEAEAAKTTAESTGGAPMQVDHAPALEGSEDQAVTLTTEQAPSAQTNVSAEPPANAGTVGEKDPENNSIRQATPEQPSTEKHTRPKPHWVDFELMQEKLLSKDDGYFSLRMFLRDVERMQENVIGAEMDLDKRSKAAFMVNEASLILKDHFQDEQQKLDFDRMAAREYAKKQLRKKTEKSTASSPVGTRASARLKGSGPELSLPDILRLEKNHKKRSRDGSHDNASTISESRVSKKNRHEVVDLAAEAVNGPPPIPDSSHIGPLSSAAVSSAPSMSGIHGGYSLAMAAPTQTEVLSGQLEQASTVPEPPPLGLPNGMPYIPTSAAAAPHPAPAHVIPTYEPAPLISHPPFYVPQDMLGMFKHMLINDTAGFTVEDLEQLRALTLQIIWKYRSDWIRGDMLKQLGQESFRFIEQVRRGH